MQAINWILLGLLIAVLIEDTIPDGIETGQRGGMIYDNTRPIGPHHWNLPAVKGYQNFEPTIKYLQVSVFRQSTQSLTQMFYWDWCVW